MTRHELFIRPDTSVRLIRRDWCSRPPHLRAQDRERILDLVERAPVSALARLWNQGVYTEPTDADLRHIAEAEYL